MRYGHPTIFALHCLALRIWAQFLFDFRRVYPLHRRVGSKIAAAAAILVFFGGWMYAFSLIAESDAQGSDVFGHYATFAQYQGPRYPVPEAPAATVAFPIVTVEGLTSGHRCVERANVQAIPAPQCLASNAELRADLPVFEKDNWSATCCTRVVPGSDREPLGWSRQAFLFVGMPRNGGFLSTLSVLLIVAMLVALAAGIGFMALSPLTALVLLALTLTSNLLALLRLLGTLYLTARRLPARVWPDTPVTRPWLIQLTDLHVTEGTPYELKVDPAAFTPEEPVPSGAALHQRVLRVVSEAARRQPACVAVTGDITDCGSRAEWQRFRDIWRTVFPPGAELQVAMVPGNHDVSFNKCEAPDPSGRQKSEMEARFSRIEHELCRSTGTQGHFHDFPVLQTVERHDDPVHMLSLNSCRYDSHFILSNAVGRLGRDQLESLRLVLGTLSGPVVVLLHHHLALQPGRLSWRNPFNSALELMKMPLDARELVELLSAYARQHPVLVIHGHQHENLRFIVDGEAGGPVHVFGLASSTLGHVDLAVGKGHAALDGRLRIGLIDFEKSVGWMAEALVLEK